ncbi:UNVERIFIED_CONTAM: hypothetical protein HDU68_008614 [Siphonaria sp. JEL0065]|nr:hypothetical protein HDU68_008614 [Siphonaria sp. JEL0065]
MPNCVENQQQEAVVQQLIQERYRQACDNPATFGEQVKRVLAGCPEGSYAWAVCLYLLAWASEQVDDFAAAAEHVRRLLEIADQPIVENINWTLLPPLVHPHPLSHKNTPLLKLRLETLAKLAIASAAAVDQQAPTILQSATQKLLYRVQLRGSGLPRVVSRKLVDPIPLPVMLASDMGLFRTMDFETTVKLRISAIGSLNGLPDFSTVLSVDPSSINLDNKGKAVALATVDFATLPNSSPFWFYLEPINCSHVVPLLTGPILVLDDISGTPDPDELIAADIIRPLPMKSSIDTAATEYILTYEESDSGIHGRLWDSAVVLCGALPGLLANLGREDTGHVTPLKVLDLGCGVGTVGLMIASLTKCHVVLGDLPECLSLPQKNLVANTAVIKSKQSTVRVASLPWGHIPILQHLGKFDVIVAADVVYEVEFFDDLITTLDHLSAENGKTEIWLVYKRRGLSMAEESGFFARMDELFVDVSKDEFSGSTLALGSVARSIGCYLRRYRKL